MLAGKKKKEEKREKERRAMKSKERRKRKNQFGWIKIKDRSIEKEDRINQNTTNLTLTTNYS